MSFMDILDELFGTTPPPPPKHNNLTPLLAPSIQTEESYPGMAFSPTVTSWACRTCTFQNKITSAQCDMCGTSSHAVTPLPPALPAVPKWTCSQCGCKTNDTDTATCSVCGTPPRGAGPGGLSSAPGRIVFNCTVCTLENLVEVATCKACGAPNPNHRGAAPQPPWVVRQHYSANDGDQEMTDQTTVWSCGQCTFENPNRSAKCEMCAMTCISISLLVLGAAPPTTHRDPYIYGEVTQRYHGLPKCKITDQWDYEIDVDVSQCPPNPHFRHCDIVEGNHLAVWRPCLSRLSDGTVGIQITDGANLRVDVTEWTQQNRQTFVHKCRVRGNMKFKAEQYADAHGLYNAGLRHVMVLDPGPTRDEMQYLLEINGATAAGMARLPHDILEHAKRATCLRPEASKGWYWQGVARTALGQWEDARKCLERAAEISPGDGDITKGLEVMEEKRKLAREKSVAVRMMTAL